MDEVRIFSMMGRDRARSNDLKLEHRKFCTNMWKTFFTAMDGALEQVAQRGYGISF